MSSNPRTNVLVLVVFHLLELATALLTYLVVQCGGSSAPLTECFRFERSG